MSKKKKNTQVGGNINRPGQLGVVPPLQSSIGNVSVKENSFNLTPIIDLLPDSSTS